MAPALRYLEAPEMIALSTDWLGPRRSALSAAPELAALLPRLEEAHHALLRAQKAAPAAPDGQTQRLEAEARSLDERHDHAVRALYYAASAAHSYLLSSEDPDPEAVGRLEALLDMILPEGLATTQATYEAEAAMASRAAEAVASDPEAQKLLREIKLLPRVTGLDLLARWSDLGTRLGSVELKRSSTQHSSDPIQARNAWLNVVASMLSVLHVARSPELSRAVNEPLDEACARASRRRRQKLGSRARRASVAQPRRISPASCQRREPAEPPLSEGRSWGRGASRPPPAGSSPRRCPRPCCPLATPSPPCARHTPTR